MKLGACFSPQTLPMSGTPKTPTTLLCSTVRLRSAVLAGTQRLHDDGIAFQYNMMYEQPKLSWCTVAKRDLVDLPRPATRTLA